MGEDRLCHLYTVSGREFLQSFHLNEDGSVERKMILNLTLSFIVRLIQPDFLFPCVAARMG